MDSISAAVERQLSNCKRAMIFEFDGTPVYNRPDTESTIIGYLDMHTRIYVYNEINGFYYISRNLNFGYVPKGSVIEVVE